MSSWAEKSEFINGEKSNYWQCSAFFGGKRLRTSTKEESLSLAKEYAEDWYLDLKVKHKRGELKNEKTFEQAAHQFLREFEIITEGERSNIYVKGHKRRVEKYLIPFFGDKGLSEITSGLVQEYRIHRKLQHQEKHERSIGHSTIHQEVVCIRQILKIAVRHNWLSYIPDLSKAYQGSTKISHRAWFSADEYKSLYEATRRRANNPPHERWRREYEQIHDFVLFMANTGLRPDEAYRLQYRDVDIVEDESTGETILDIEVRGKRGVGYCKSMPGAVRAFQRLYDRNEPAPSDLVFPGRHTRLFNIILDELELK